MIGIVGGVGPYTGLDLCKKICDQTQSKIDQEHVSFALLSMPKVIEDRTAFLLGNSDINPAQVISKLILTLEKMGAEIIGIPCNTMYAPQIYDLILRELAIAQSKVKLIHLIDEVATFILQYYPKVTDVGILATVGTYKANIYHSIFKSQGLNAVFPSLEVQTDLIHSSIYDLKYGIKAQSSPVTEKAKRQLMEGINYLKQKNVQAIVLACTELALAITDEIIEDLLIVDSTMVLARALLREEAPQKLKPYIVQKSILT